MSDPHTPPEPIDIGEFRAVSNLLRQLDDPEPPEGLRAQVMERVSAEHANPPGLRRVFRRQQPGIAAALAAGIAGYVFLAAPSNDFVGTAPATIAYSPGDVPGRAPAEARTPRRTRIVSSSGIGAPARIAATSPQTPFGGDAMLAASRLDAAADLPTLDRRLDHQIDGMLHQPDAFFRRLKRIRHHERYLARLAERSARRGDSAAIALRVRNSGHPLAPQIAEQFLRASRAQSLSQPRTTRGSADSGLQPTPVFSH